MEGHGVLFTTKGRDRVADLLTLLQLSLHQRTHMRAAGVVPGSTTCASGGLP